MEGMEPAPGAHDVTGTANAVTLPSNDPTDGLSDQIKKGEQSSSGSWKIINTTTLPAIRDFTFLTTHHSKRELNDFRRGQQCKESNDMLRAIDGYSRRIYRCSEKGCPYLLCALVPGELAKSSDETEEGPIHLYVKGNHTDHNLRTIGVRLATARTSEWTMLDEVDSQEEVKQRQKALRLTSCHAKNAVRLRYRCGGCPLRLHADPSTTGPTSSASTAQVTRWAAPFLLLAAVVVVGARSRRR